MDKHWAYCSACDRQVEVTVDPTGGVDPVTGDSVEALVCLEVGHTCTGALCPITDATPEEMRQALDRLRAVESDSDAEE
jgi:metal-sulfur cluster biosynthetic enzyme